MFGRLLPQKGFYTFLSAARALKEKYGDQVSFWVLGSTDHNRKESVTLHQALSHANAEGTVRLMEHTDDVLPVLRQADAVVLPSTYNEGVPRSLLEALACGKPIITTDWKGCRETVLHGKNGYLIPPRDQDALETSIERVLLCSPEQLAQMGNASRVLAQDRFDERIVVDRYLTSIEIPPLEQDVEYDEQRSQQAA